MSKSKKPKTSVEKPNNAEFCRKAILTLLAKSDEDNLNLVSLYASISAVKSGIDISDVSKRCTDLINKGWVERVGTNKGIYKITAKGFSAADYEFAIDLIKVEKPAATKAVKQYPVSIASELYQQSLNRIFNQTIGVCHG